MMKPIDSQYKMPAEWTTHQRTLLSWPVQEAMVHPEDYESVCQWFKELVTAITQFEPVTVVVNPDDTASVSNMLSGVRDVQLLPIAHNDAWLRDNGPTFLINQDLQLAGVNWGFNAWGGKYAPWDLDDKVAPQVLAHYAVTTYDAPLILEGGSIHVDGEGTLLTTEECLLNPNRNPDLTKEAIEGYLADYLGITKVIWLKKGLDGDETDGHIDNIACFARPGEILLQVCEDPQDENYAITQENLDILNQARDAKGRQLQIIPIQQPPKRVVDGKRLTLSYLNFYFVNGGIILPVFGGTAEETDRQAIQVLQNTFPDRRIRTIDGMPIIREGGNVHCVTQQMAKGN
jgi:agmatine deiminase